MENIKLNWQDLPDEKDSPSKTGEVITHTNIKMANTPIGNFWVGMSKLITASGESIDLPYNVCWNQSVTPTKITNQDEIIALVEKDYTTLALQMHAQVAAHVQALSLKESEEIIEEVQPDVAVMDSAVVENIENAV